VRGERAQVRRPRLALAPAHRRLAEVVEHEGLLGETRGELDRGRHLPRVDEEVVDEIVPRELGEPAAEILAQQEVVGLVLSDVAQPDQPRIARRALDLLGSIGRAQVHPSDDTTDPGVFPGELEQPARLREALPRLHRDARIDAVLLEQRLEIRGREVALQRGQRRSDPRIFLRRVAPEVLVGVDAHHPPGYLGPRPADHRADPTVRHFMSRVPRSLALIAGLALWCACSPQAHRPRRIAVIPKGTTHEFWKAVHAGAERAARELSVELEWKGPLKEDDRTAQIQVVEDFVVRGVDGIVLMPLDDQALVAPAREASERGIPVVIGDSDLAWPGRVSFVATDNARGGRMGGEELARLLGGRGKVILMRYSEGSASIVERERGFLEAVAAQPGIEVVSSNQYAGASVESAYKTAENLLNSFPQLDGIFCPNESSTFGMLRALQDAGRAGHVHFVGFDASQKLVEALRGGQLDALVLQNPVAIGELSVRALVDHLDGKPVEPRIDTGVHLATRENLDVAPVRELLAPDLSILGG